jgi:hypothetical protein
VVFLLHGVRSTTEALRATGAAGARLRDAEDRREDFEEAYGGSTDVSRRSEGMQDNTRREFLGHGLGNGNLREGTITAASEL